MPRTAKQLKEISSIARQYTHRALRTLDGIMRHPKSSEFARIAAANALLERGWGKPTTEHRGDALTTLAVQINNIRHEIVDAKAEPPLLADATCAQHDEIKQD